MAERRMFTKKIIESDAFIEMPLSAQALYFHLNMAADDDGFLNNPRRIMRSIGASEDDYRLLVAKSFIIIFDSGIIVIKHWKMHNYIQKDRYHPSGYVEEKSMLGLKKNMAYTLDENQMCTKCIQDVSIGKSKVRVRDSIYSKKSKPKNSFNDMIHTDYDMEAIERAVLEDEEGKG